MMHMMNEKLWTAHDRSHGASWLLGLGLVASLIVLVWTAVGRLRQAAG